MLGHELLRHRGAHRVTKQHNRYSRMFSSDMAVEHPQVIQAQPPTIARAQEAELISIFASLAMATMIVGVNRKACAGKRLCQASISSGMLGHPMSNLHHGYRLTSRQPTIYK